MILLEAGNRLLADLVRTVIVPYVNFTPNFHPIDFFVFEALQYKPSLFRFAHH